MKFFLHVISLSVALLASAEEDQASSGRAEARKNLAAMAVTIDADGKWMEGIVQAAGDGDLKKVELFLQSGANVNTINKKSKLQALSAAAAAGKVDVVKLLLKNGASVAVCKDAFSCPLTAACFSGNIEIAQLILDAGGKINVVHEAGNTPLSDACSRNHIDLVDLLIKNGGDVNLGEYRPLSVAAGSGNLSMVTHLLNLGAKTDVPSISGIQPLHRAADGGHLDVVEVLLTSGANPNAKELKHGATPLDIALRSNNNKHKEVVKLLEKSMKAIKISHDFPSAAQAKASLEKIGVVFDKENKWMNGVAGAIERNDFENFKNYIACGVDLNRKYEFLESSIPCDRIIHKVVLLDSVEMLDVLIKNKVDVKQKGLLDVQAIHYAAVSNKCATLKALIDAGADINSSDNPDQMTPLHLSLEKVNIEVIKLLIAAGANKNAKNKRGETAYDRAVKRRIEKEILDLLNP
jgi:ankyrin repeat protein